MSLHLLKMAAGISSIDELRTRQSRHAEKHKRNNENIEVSHITRMWPRRMDELLDGGSIYWVFSGGVRARQRLIDLREYRDKEGIRRCRIVFDGEIIETVFQPKRAFQGWRYLKGDDAPSDILVGKDEEGSQELREELKEFGLL